MFYFQNFIEIETFVSEVLANRFKLFSRFEIFQNIRMDLQIYISFAKMHTSCVARIFEGEGGGDVMVKFCLKG